jgi:hypothetical protein
MLPANIEGRKVTWFVLMTVATYRPIVLVGSRPAKRIGGDVADVRAATRAEGGFLS